MTYLPNGTPDDPSLVIEDGGAETQAATDRLLAFVRWCRTNSASLVFDPEVARRVHEAYLGEVAR